MQYRVADEADMMNMLPPFREIDKAAYNPDQVDLVFHVDLATDTIKHGRAVDTAEGTYQMFNVVLFGDCCAELVPVGPWLPIAKGDSNSGR